MLIMCIFLSLLLFLQLFITLSLFPSRFTWLPEHSLFPSHYNAMLILNMEPTVVGSNEWPNRSASISPSIIADWTRRRGCFVVCSAGGRQRWLERAITEIQFPLRLGFRRLQSTRWPCPDLFSRMPSMLHHICNNWVKWSDSMVQ